MPEPETTKRTTWPQAEELQQAADTKRATGDPADTALADWLDATANTLAWLAPYRPHEGGHDMWQAATAYARLINASATPGPVTAALDAAQGVVTGRPIGQAVVPGPDAGGPW